MEFHPGSASADAAVVRETARLALTARNAVCGHIVTEVISLSPYREVKRNCRFAPKFEHTDGLSYCTRHYNEIIEHIEHKAKAEQISAQLSKWAEEHRAFEQAHALDPCKACGHAYEHHRQHDCQHVMNYNCGRDGEWRCSVSGCACGLAAYALFDFLET